LTTILADLTSAAIAARAPSFPPPHKINIGGVDPLGLRQINFDLLDRVLVGINNVASHVRPFVVVAWAWRRATELAEESGKRKVEVELLRDFVDRIEVIYAWSQFLLDRDADLPGRAVLEFLFDAPHYKFSGADWAEKKRVRRYSTGFSSPINYGPALRSLGWVERSPADRDIFAPLSGTEQALDAFEAKIADRLKHPAFSKLGPVTVTGAEVRKWAEAWALESPTKAERNFAWAALAGPAAVEERRLGVELATAAARHVGSSDAVAIRRAMAGRPSDFVPPTGLAKTANNWRQAQVRQLFRLALEAGLYWIVNELREGSRQSAYLVDRFIKQCLNRPQTSDTRGWLLARPLRGKGPVELMIALESALSDPNLSGVTMAIADAIAFSLAEAPHAPQSFEQNDRLPISRARDQAEALAGGPIQEFIQHMLETWVLAQHVYWSVERGLADARAGGKVLLRLRVMLEEGGWTSTPGTTANRPPRPTPDRLQTIISLAQECGVLKNLN
jgi:hypothetical protein